VSNTAASELVTACLDNIARASSTTTVLGATYETLALRWLNQTMTAINAKHTFTDLYATGVSVPAATVAGTKTYAFPTGWSEIFAVIVVDGTNSRKLRLRMPRHALRDNPYPEADSTGTPICYIPYGDNFDLSPIPDDYAAVTLTGSIDPAASTTVTGVGTLFLTELAAGNRIKVSGETRIVATIVSNTELTVTDAFTDGANDTAPVRLDGYSMLVRYSKLPTVITSTATLIDYAPDKDELLIAGMTSRAHLYLQQYEDAAAWANVFKGLLKDAIEGDMYPIDWEPKGEGFGYRRIISGDYWNQPFIRNNP
jgi:hypothetical protein